MPARRSLKGLLKLPYSRKAFEKVRKRLGLKTAQRLAKNRKLFRYDPVEVRLAKILEIVGPEKADEIRLILLSEQSDASNGGHPKRKLTIEPGFKQVHPRNAKRVYENARRENETLYQIRDGRIRPFRSKAYQRQSHARLLNLKLRPLALYRQNLEYKLRNLSADFKVNDFEDVSDLHKHIPILKKMVELRLEFAKVDIRMAKKKLDYYDRFPSRQNRPVVIKVEDSLIELEKLKDKYSRQKKALNSIEGDLRLLVTQLKIRQRLSLELTSMLAKENNPPEHPTGEQLSNVLKITNLREQFNQARVNQFEAEMKLLHLYGVHFSGRTESAIKKDVIAAQEKVREAVIKRRRLSKDE